ncbi:protein of unknown function [Clostridium sp. DSM 8431]|uniref:DUF4879 domain-containing protein n=1 Tax=Clostridium sp. DSM 8431 TaxID=1761781 RepID=UPI0008E77AF4|nr:DUF4879 domain-containing protein [Clostridium sp. DSM 8431]SFU34810.1 protein of unknown function [Clostridium sp. DSM 8431]
MKKLTKVFSVFFTVLLLASVAVLGTSAQKASAAPAPKLTQLQIIGCSTPEIYNYDNRHLIIPRESLSSGKFAGSTIYVATHQMGYGQLSFSVDGGAYQRVNEIDRFYINGFDSNGARAVVGWNVVSQISGLSVGQHTIRVLGISTVGGGTMSDAVTVTVG